MQRVILPAIALVTTLALVLGAAQPANAHETRNVGPYKVVVGWQDEPAFAGVANAIQFRVSDAQGKAVEGLAQTVKAEVRAGGLAAMSLTLSESDETPGLYTAAFVPTREGGYSFHFTGKIESTTVDETFSSGPNTFDDVASLSSIQYPDKVPSGGDLATQLADLQNGLNQMRIVSLAGLLVGAIALGAAVWRRRA